MRARGVLAAVVVGAALAMAGCGRDLEDAEVAAAERVSLNAEQRVAVRASRALEKPNSPASVVMTFIQDLREGAGPALYTVYDSRIPDRVGKGNVLGALQVMSGITAGTRPVVTRRRKTSAGELVVVRLLRTVGSDSRYSFLLRREGKRWKIVYDSLMVQGLQSYVSSRVSGSAGQQTGKATQAAARAVLDMQLATLHEEGSDRRPASAGSARPTATPGSAIPDSGTTTTPAAGTGTTPAE